VENLLHQRSAANHNTRIAVNGV